MFPEQLLYSPPAYSRGVPDEQPTLRSQALSLYSAMLTKGKWNKVTHSLKRRQIRLLDRQFYKNPECGLNRHYMGVQSVSIERIRGSEGRIEDFDNSFNPTHERLRNRWLSIAALRLVGAALPPVELIRVCEIYFVRDGHHRISVAKALGEQYIDAEVTEETC